MSDTQIYGEYRGVGSLGFDLALDGQVKKIPTVPPEELGLADFEVGGDFTVGLDGHPNSASTELDWDANPVAGNFRITMFNTNEVFSNGDGILPFGLDALIEPLSLLFVGRVEFGAGVTSEESLKSFVLVVEDQTLDVGQLHDLRLDDLLNLHRKHRYTFAPHRSSPFGTPPTESIRFFLCSIFSKTRLFWLFDAFFSTFGPQWFGEETPKVFQTPLSSPP